jgi:ubiquinone/menaquinone biosynthesis C-methylase UbiE
MEKINNVKAWDALYAKHYFSGGTFLPAWGVYSSGSTLTRGLLKIKDQQILEIACGMGESVPYIIKHKPKQYIGIDASGQGLSQARIKYQFPNVSFVRVDISKKFPFRTDSFDAIFSVYGIGWSQNIRRTLFEIYRVLKPGGTFTFSWDHYLARIVDERAGKIFIQKSYNIKQPTIHKDWNHAGYAIQSMQAKPSTWFKLLQDAGFEITALHELEISGRTAKKHVFSKTYSADRAKLIPFGIIMQGRKPL